MQDEFRPAAVLGAQALEQVHVLPARQHLGLALRQLAAHRKVGLRQEDGGFVVSCHWQLGAKGAMGDRRNGGHEQAGRPGRGQRTGRIIRS